MINRAFKGVWIPSEIWLNKSLTIMEKLFLIEIDSLDNNSGCFASNAHFSEFFDVSKGRCTQIIKSLEAKELVKITLFKEGNQIKKRTIRVVNKLNTPSENIKYPYLENDDGSNTSLSNTSTKTKGFKPPSQSEVDSYCKERKNGIDAFKFINYYQANGWMRGKNKIKDWKACVRTWEGNNKQQTKTTTYKPMPKPGE